MTPGREQSLPLSIAIASGTGTGTLSKVWTICRWIRVIPIAETDSFDVTIKDSDGYIMFTRTGQIGTLAERIEMSCGIMATILIANTTQDGTYRVRLDLH